LEQIKEESYSQGGVRMRTTVSIGVLVLVFTVSTVILGTQRGQAGGRAVGAASATGTAEKRHNPGESADHKSDTAVQKDSNGFKNYGQYVAATQVSKHLNIPLADLKKAMVDDNLSLGQAIHKLKPTLSTQQVEAETKKAEAAAKKAEAEAKRKKAD
jgi:hypothetical protein